MLNIPPSADGLGGRYIKNKHMKKLRYIILLTAVLSLPLSAQTNPALQVEVKQTGGWVFCNHPKLAVFLFKNQTPTFV